ncbi:hypothetical protein MJO28_014876 [Puccinia striiformis f. sp. tritici]|uniref:Uncharacterized protein n=1 Tax=Puccinia striiformis f. sp. tritici TaxID=168172 RepID=A0ACC0DS45_9BASI|nr:hypothetical protein MJO28_014876 [Puccinia striiformis f. sp. tritici]
MYSSTAPDGFITNTSIFSDAPATNRLSTLTLARSVLVIMRTGNTTPITRSPQILGIELLKILNECHVYTRKKPTTARLSVLLKSPADVLLILTFNLGALIA